MKSLGKVTKTHYRYVIAVPLILSSLSLEILSLHSYRHDIFMAVMVVFGFLIATVLAQPNVIFRSILWGVMLSDTAISLYLAWGSSVYGEGPDVGTYILLLFGLAVLSSLSLLKLTRARVVPTIILLALAANAGVHVYYSVLTIILSGRIYFRIAFFLFIGLLNLACFLLSLLLLLRSRGMFLRKTGSVQMDRL